MRILTVSAFYESHGGGIEIVAGAMTRALACRGHECSWAAAGFDALPGDTLIKPVPLAASDPVERWAGLPMPIPSRAGRCQLERAVESADAVVIHDALYVSSLLAALYAQRHRKPWILIQHIGNIPYTRLLLRLAMAVANRLISRPLIARAPQTVFISNEVYSFFAEVPSRRPPKLLYNGVDHALFRLPHGRERTEIRARLGMRSDRRQILFVGRFVEKKGLSALRELATANPQWDLSLVGSGPINPIDWKLPNVRVLGRKDRRQVADLYRAADALVLPSTGEGFPLVVQEAMASGLPVFCGLDSAAADPAAGNLLGAVEVSPSQPRATAERFGAAISRAADGPNPRLAEYSRATYDWDANARWLDEQLSELLADFSGAACTLRNDGLAAAC